ncbi:hypothetical protein BDV33DRAFT_210611 [Aspergillus novoparasiticus]|uniref:Uncharacterized protein n=1 Tax=Aspergillus novoparasiticus TaxID=986946 RepID=A0A5N6E6X3_9EURO|nr:hypothetical protein BDV33DRAFT_210611 [Aspergillus novoparasiticus]
MAAKTWFLTPGTTFTPDGIIRLGAIIADFKRPTLILLEPDANPALNLPPVQVLHEQNHVHSRNISSSVSVKIWAKFLDLVSPSVRLELASRKMLEYGATDHEVHQFKKSFTSETLTAIISQPAVRQYINSGLYGKRPIYIISGLRVAKTGMAVAVEKGYTRGGGVEGSGPLAGTVPVEVGMDVHGERKMDNTDSWVTAPGVVFAYRLNIIREKKSGNRESEIFSHRTAFMTGFGGEDVEMEIGEVLLEELLEDPEEDRSDLMEYRIGKEDTCILFQPPEE